ncbi:hypothetical protein EV421DRAFT_1012354 [Armillaria borealis]|uniref:DUF6533 domain-containing protein n=1 Tax=Armillaria borealis TaxID=47425 RepID=A0AA39J7K2_9AGAR|nr:hypothetical protein EV421DRAFT_1012354 [Armillaria borealis]
MDISQTQRLLRSIENTRYAVFAAATIMLYDHVLSFHREVELIWRRRTSFINNVFLWHRYFGLFCILFELSVVVDSHVTASLYVRCSTPIETIQAKYNLQRIGSFWLRWEIVSISVSILTSELVLMSWIYVIYDRNTQVVAMLLCLYAAEVVTTFTILGVSLDHAHTTNHIISPELYAPAFCSLTEIPPLYNFYWVPNLAYNGVVFTLFILKSYQVLGCSTQPKQKQVLYDVYRNSAMNYVTMFSAYLLCCILWISADFALARIPVMFALCFSIMNATRLLLNVRHVYFTHTSSRINIRRDSDDSVLAEFDGTEERWMYELRELRWNGPSGTHV